ncbi:MAG TPA: 2-C-methyl-D-erythritol 4-phosphate cytidylyltransferase [Candidatus Dormibacteraeota bacterium]|jgi:2-C-methyl-D-erythritol 4-phosphate cytidylyltransferase|nr:2-C-methyl-D-erythritol 4-phosphate cytidylyltransferase [Candidatus Dormibacteraeota bacterium]
MRAAAIVVAGGQGTRMGARLNKVFMEVDGRSILEHSLDLFESIPLVGQIVLVTRQADLSRCDPLRARFRKLSAVVAGGDLRHRSEFAGLRSLAARIDAGEVDTVLVHDAVRPFASPALVERLIAGVVRTVGCIPGLPVGRATALVADGWIAGYPPNLWTVQTPQAFQATWLLEAHNKAARQGFIGTDTASVVEWAGGDVSVLEGEPDNIKITTPEDLARAEAIAAGRRP